MSYKDKLLKEVWTKDSYYSQAKKGSGNNSHPVMVILNKLVKNSSNILDVGCGEGTRLNFLAQNNPRAVGIDVSAKAIELANQKYPGNKHLVGDSEKVPFEDGYFDLVYSAFVFEHLDNPEKVFGEMKRVCKKGGTIVIAAPNFGAPNRISPPNNKNRLRKLVIGFFRDYVQSPKSLDWLKVTPIATSSNYEIDFDTTVEPYLLSLKRYVKSLGLEVLYDSSLWKEEDPNAGYFQKVIKFLGKVGVFPFKYWGPHLLIVLKKLGR